MFYPSTTRNAVVEVVSEDKRVTWDYTGHTDTTEKLL